MLKYPYISNNIVMLKYPYISNNIVMQNYVSKEVGGAKRRALYANSKTFALQFTPLKFHSAGINNKFFRNKV